MNLAEIQAALREEGLDGWLFFDHHRRDPLAYRVLKFTPNSIVSRRWYYFIPAHGEPTGLVHKIEAQTLSELPGTMSKYAGWTEMVDAIRKLLGTSRRIAMQYSPNCAVPYVAMVDAGTVELIRGLGVEIATSANLVQYFEARWSKSQLEQHLEAGRRVDRVRREAFDRIGQKLRASEHVTEWDIQQFIATRFRQEGLFADHDPDVAVNANASNPHYAPKQDSASAIKKHDIVLIDMWAKLDQADAVYYDITWMGYCGPQPPSAMENVFEVVRQARDRAIHCVQDAAASKHELHGYEVDDAARDFIRERGFGEYFFHRTGHSIGTDIHGTGANMDNLETHDERKVIPGTCFSVEPGIYLPEFGVRSEVNVYLDETAARVTGEKQETIVLI
ncbi:MAG TPA: M24 family metallopeptidase [Bryobacteraceae bacterium]|jgi:Xaa-Pro dipeptidase|nr:M24 family metallopeptidase [Bryobacteraceae bacterium]